MAMAVIAGSPKRSMIGITANAHTIVATLNIAGESAGMKNRRSEFSIPIMATAAATVVRNGSMILVNVVVSSSLPGTSANPGAIACVIG